MRLPPLNALRAFEAAARHGGFIDAADELHVSRGAISRHVKLLEEHLGVALFVRGPSGVSLTHAGNALQPVLTDAFARIAQGVRRATEGDDTLRIICPPAMSVRWLLPRLPEFRAQHPEIRLSVTTDFFGDRGFDGIEYHIGFSIEHPIRPRPATIRVERLLPYVLTPACAPAYAEAHGPFHTPEDLARCTIIHERGTTGDWRDWHAAFGPDGLDITKGDSFPNFDLATKAATMGVGVVMADLALCHEELSAGSLVPLFPDLRCDSPRGWFGLLCRDDLWDTPAVAAFRSWAAKRAEADRAEIFGETG